MNGNLKIQLLIYLKSKKQSFRFLKEGDAYSLLGLVCELYRKEFNKGSWEGPFTGRVEGTQGFCFLLEDSWSTETPSPRIQEWAGLTDSEIQKMFEWNNVNQFSFSEIEKLVKTL